MKCASRQLDIRKVPIPESVGPVGVIHYGSELNRPPPLLSAEVYLGRHFHVSARR